MWTASPDSSPLFIGLLIRVSGPQHGLPAPRGSHAPVGCPAAVEARQTAAAPQNPADSARESAYGLCSPCSSVLCVQPDITGGPSTSSEGTSSSRR